jgi:phosphatidylserine/phosphatidylglycerophosphate/cardiolipin synthase-like enzyme
MAFSFTSDKIGEAMINSHKRGVRVSGVFEKRGAKTKYSEYIKMRVEGIPVKMDKNRYNMHHKVIIIDDELVITGSYNFSKNASKRNDENVIMIRNKKIASQYLAEFNRIYK